MSGPQPQAPPHAEQIKHAARVTLFAGAVITIFKFGLFVYTDSAAVLTDALESLVNIAAALFMLYVLWYSHRPADQEHPYGHGKMEFLAVGMEGWLILLAGVLIAYEAVRRLLTGTGPQHLEVGLWLLLVIGVMTGSLAFYVIYAGKKYDSPTLLADGKHLLTDFISTVGVLIGLWVVHLTGKPWLDPLVAIAMAIFIFWTSWRLLWQSTGGLLDRIDPEDAALIRQILDEEVRTGSADGARGIRGIRGYHKVRHRHSGTFHWVDMHLQVDPDLTVREGHEIASRIEHRIEQALGQANASAHIEPYEES